MACIMKSRAHGIANWMPEKLVQEDINPNLEYPKIYSDFSLSQNENTVKPYAKMILFTFQLYLHFI